MLKPNYWVAVRQRQIRQAYKLNRLPLGGFFLGSYSSRHFSGFQSTIMIGFLDESLGGVDS